MHLHLEPEDGVETEDGGASVPFLAPEAGSGEKAVEAPQRARSRGSSRAHSGTDEKARLFSKERLRSMSQVYEIGV
jgi:hypothetical protein